MNVPILDLKKQDAPLQKEIRKRIDGVLDNGKFVLGPEVQTLEKNLAEYSNANYALGVSSGTDALILALLTIGIQPEDEVITSPFTFFASAETISLLGGKPVFVDIDPQTFCIDPSKLEAAITPKTRAIMPIHIFGQCANMDPIMGIAKKHRLPVIEDACQAIGAEHTGKKACSMGDFAAMSFYPSKNLGSYGDSGMLFVKNEQDFTIARELRTHGEYPKGYNHKRIGMNARMDAFQAAVLNVKSRYIDEWNSKRQKVAENYYRLFEEANLLKKITLPQTGSGNTHVYHLYSILTEKKWDLAKHLKENNIGCGIHFPKPIPFLEAYKDLGFKAGDFPVSENVCSKSLALPMFPEMTLQQQEYVVSVIKKFF